MLIKDTNIRVLGPVAELNYFDTQAVLLKRELSPLEAWNTVMSRPQPLLKIAFQIRDGVSSLFGVKRIGGFTGKQRSHVQSGDYLDFFLVEHADTCALVLTERDRHLDVMTCISTKDAEVTITSSVQVHNLFGYFYMIPVGIAHRWIVRGMLSRLAREITE